MQNVSLGMFDTGATTHAGRVRVRNEDSYLTRPEAGTSVSFLPLPLRPGDHSAHRRGSRERNRVNIGVVDERNAGVACSGDDVHHSRGQIGLLEDLGENERGQQRGLRGF